MPISHQKQHPIVAFFEQYYLAWIMLLTLCAFALRLPGLTWGTPMVEHYNSDNERFVQDAVKMSSHRDLNPGWFGHPGSTVIYPLAFIFSATNLVDRHLGTTKQYVGELFEKDSTPFYVIGRIYAALLGAATIPVCLSLGKRSGNVLGGLFAALILTFSPLHNVFSHMARTGVVATYFGSLGGLFGISIVKKPAWRNYLLTGLFLGLAISTRYSMLLFAIILPTAHMAKLWSFPSRRKPFLSSNVNKLVVAMLIIALTFAITTPFFFLDFTNALANLLTESRKTHLSADGFTPLQNFWWYLSAIIPGGGYKLIKEFQSSGGLGIIASLLAILGGIAAFRRRNTILIIYTILIFVFLVGISVHALHWNRWVLPILPFAAVLAGEGVGYFQRSIRSKRPIIQVASFGLILLMAVEVGLMFAKDYTHNINRVTTDTRQLAQEWVEENLPQDSKIIAESYSVPITPGTFTHNEYIISIGFHSLDFYRENQFDYLIISTRISQRYMAEPNKYPEIIATYQQIKTELPQVYSIDPKPRETVGPTIYIYRLSENDS